MKHGIEDPPAARPSPAPARKRRLALLLLAAVVLLTVGWRYKDPVQLWYVRRGTLADLESYAARRPDSVDAALALGNAFLRERRPRDAVDHLDPAVARYPANPTLRVLFALALLDAGEFGRGHDALELAVHRLGATDPDTLVLLGRVEQRAGDEVQARAEYEQALRENPRAVGALLELGWLDDHYSHFTEALNDYQRAAAAAPRSAGAAAGIAGDDFHLGRLDEAVAQARRALALAPNNRKGNFWLGRSLQALDTKRYGAEAEAAYRRAIAAASSEKDHERFYLAQLLRLQGRLPEAAAALEETLKENMFDTPAYYELALCARGLGQEARAGQAMTRFKRLNKIDLGTTHLVYQLSLAPDDLPLRMKLASFYFATGRPGLAAPEVMNVLRKRPNDVEALRLFARIKAHPKPWL